MKKYALYQLRDMLGAEKREDVNWDHPRTSIKVPSVDNPVSTVHLMCKDDVKSYAADFTGKFGQSLFEKRSESEFFPVENRKFQQLFTEIQNFNYKQSKS